MMLKPSNSGMIENPQARTIENAGGTVLEGNFSWTSDGWEITLKRLTFEECVQIADAANGILRGHP